ncbi:MAG: DUF3990 domain-containing protein [Blautia sp.]|uniref:DUF3990 domain-containing protein n=1 Tax=unclassified Blautia TaxID=2648079 RepID=UPI001FD5161E|nr:DUF3990 domain-containing protein [Blautia sp. NSJ-175]MCJ7845732.1 DUF3990 domain-containing protein [Blautia sp. NSJ-175]
MILYHDSFTEVRKPDISYSRDTLDFGKGFYVTPIYEQAKKWSLRFKRKKGKSVISWYELDEKKLRHEARIKEFSSYSEEWLDYIITCRGGMNTGQYDIIIGGVANDKVFDTIELFFDGLIDKNMAIQRLKYEKPNLQYCICSQEILDKYLIYQKSEVL